MRKGCLASALLLCAALVSGAAAAEDGWPDLSSPPKATGGGEKDAAVIVGVEHYFKVERIPGARQNAQDWHAYLTETLEIPSENVALLRDEEATLELMRQTAAEKAQAVRPGGTLWFVFIGHGAPAQDGKDGVLVGVDAQQRADSLFSRSLSRDELLGILSKGKQAKTVVLIDACFSGRSASGKALIQGLQPLVILARNAGASDARTILMTAAKADQFAGPLPRSSQSRPAFSYLALGALRGWAADAKGKVSASGLVDYVTKALMLAKDRTQTPELAAGAGDAVLAVGRESAPNLARIDREGAKTGIDFQVSSLPSVPRAEAPKEMSAKLSGIDLGSIDVEALGRYDEAFKFDKGESSPEAKAAKWRALAKAAPAYAAVAQKRAEEWELYLAEQKGAAEAQQKLIGARDADWAKLSRLLAYDVVPKKDKSRWCLQFAEAYADSPGMAPETAKALTPYVAQGPVRAKLESLTAGPPKPAPADAGIRWVAIPGGRLNMGTGKDNEAPAHRVRVKGFQMAKTEVTVAQYRACVDAGACTAPEAGRNCNWGGRGKAAKLVNFVAKKIKRGKEPAPEQAAGGKEDHPVNCVDRNQAKTFSEWVGGRLPTEAEWEYAARSAGKDWKYAWGNEAATCERAVISDRGDGCGKDSTWPVCSKAKGNTEQGLCDMSGSVWEWVQDRYHDSYQGAPADGSAWESSAGGDGVIRGGSWSQDASRARAAQRNDYDAGRRHDGVGFRPVRAGQ